MYCRLFSTVVGYHLAAEGCLPVEFRGKLLVRVFFPHILVFFPICSLDKSCPSSDFWPKNGLEFFLIVQKLRGFAVKFSEKCRKKEPASKLFCLPHRKAMGWYCLLLRR